MSAFLARSGLLFSCLVLAIGLGTTLPASAQTATNLNCNGCVGKKDLGDSAVRSNKIKDGSVKAKDMTNGAQPTAARNSFSPNSNSVTSDGATVRTVALSLENKTNLVVFATWQFGLNDNEGGNCAITLDTETYSSTFSNGSDDGNVASGVYEHAASATGVFADVSAGIHTVYLVCIADNTGITVRKPSVTVLAVPKLIPFAF